MWGADNVLTLFLPTWTLNQIFGLCNRSINDFKQGGKLSKLKICIICSYNTTTLIILIYLAVENLNFTIDQNINIVIQMTEILFSTTNIITIVSTVFFNLFYQTRILNLFKQIDDLDGILKKYRQWTTYDQIKKFIAIYIFLILLNWISFFVVYTIVLCPVSKMTCLNTWFVVYFPTKILEVHLLQFITYVCVIKNKFSILNEIIFISITEKYNNESNLDKRLAVLQKLYSSTISIFNNVMTIHSFPLLLRFTYLFITIFASIYLFIFGYTYSGTFVLPTSFTDYILPIFFVLFPTLELITVTVLCQLATSEFKNTGKLIHRISESGKNVRVNLFSLHLYHTRPDFMASGFFYINCELLQTIIGAVTIYNVLFVQFDLATNK